MGKLAERLSDERRSGVYRVEVTDALEEAVVLAGLRCTRIVLNDGPEVDLLRRCAAVLNLGSVPGWDALSSALGDPAWSHPGGDVVLVTSAGVSGAVAGAALASLTGALRAAAEAHRLRGARFFGVFHDPGRMLALAPLYDRRRHGAASVSTVHPH